MGLIKPYKVLLLDEITVDLNVLARADLLKFLKRECEERGATIIYLTHIFDGLENWPSHIAYVANGKLQLALPVKRMKEMYTLSLVVSQKEKVESWQRKELDEERAKRKERKAEGLPELEQQKSNPEQYHSITYKYISKIYRASKSITKQMKVAGAVEATEASKPIPKVRMSRVLSLLDFILCVVAALGTLASAIAMGTGKETLPFAT